MLNIFAAIAFFIAFLLIAIEEHFLIAPLGWVALGLLLMVIGGAWTYVDERRRR